MDIVFPYQCMALGKAIYTVVFYFFTSTPFNNTIIH